MRMLSAMLAGGLMVAPVFAGVTGEVRELRKAERVLNLSVKSSSKGIPKELLQRAECIGVFPEIKTGALIVGGAFGSGVFTCRRKDGTMGAPAFFTIGRSAGDDSVDYAGRQDTDFVLLIMNLDSVKHLFQDKFALGGQVSAMAGPVGRTAQAATDAQLHAPILSWSRSRGALRGASLDGTVIHPNGMANEVFYGKPISARKILVDQDTAVPEVARSFVNATTAHARRDS